MSSEPRNNNTGSSSGAPSAGTSGAANSTQQAPTTYHSPDLQLMVDASANMMYSNLSQNYPAASREEKRAAISGTFQRGLQDRGIEYSVQTHPGPENYRGD
ncbi:hypothetical protein IAT38_007809 [Cryptococcus sp. DSM 104549]